MLWKNYEWRQTFKEQSGVQRWSTGRRAQIQNVDTLTVLPSSNLQLTSRPLRLRYVFFGLGTQNSVSTGASVGSPTEKTTSARGPTFLPARRLR
ncbi:hypothetical protein TGRH88_065260 [Toxoplasma gondii]|uniref:Uncharacterized protein n=1 Tax=Toxoplasma gondii TaxID=5811 RepID=A0A7J6JVN3_TOXGO|nr:hypothetical protein TGRH88_065260 [Toxoplasma gondii]